MGTSCRSPWFREGRYTRQAARQIVVYDRLTPNRIRALCAYAEPRLPATAALGSHMWCPCIDQLGTYDALGHPILPGRHSNSFSSTPPPGACAAPISMTATNASASFTDL